MYVIGKEEAIQFVKKNCTYGKQDILDDVINDRHRSWIDEKLPLLKEALVVEGVSEIVDVYVFSESFGNKYSNEPEHYWSFEYAEYCVRLLETGEIMHPWKPSNAAKVFGLSFMLDDTVQGRLKDFKFGAQQPNFIGKGSKSKLLAWFGYRRAENEAMKEYISEANKKNAEFREKVQRCYPNARLRILADGWMSECWFSVGYVMVHFTAGEDGRFYRETKVDILAFPSTDKLFEQ